MKRIFLLVSVVVSMFTMSCSNSYDYETIPNDPLGTRIYTLNNGLKIYTSVMKEQPRIQTYIAVRVGGKNDPAETTGLAHYFEHLMFKGTPNFGTTNYEKEKPLLDEIEHLFEVYRKTTDPEERTRIYHAIDSVSYEASKHAIPNEYDKLMAVIGATGTNAYTSMDETVYEEDIPSNQIDNWARIQADRFRNPVIRGFHTELETIYEEKNMSLTNDNSKLFEAMDAALFPNHPYGTQTVLGTQENLKNPSITNVKEYHKIFYVPNNMAICVAGDFNPDEMVAAIDKYFGDMTPNKNLPKLHFKPETPITEPIEKTVLGPEAESVMIGWRLPESTDPSNDIAELASMILNNGQAGLIDLNLIQDQKLLSAYSFANTQPDYGTFFLSARPKEGQSLEEARNLVLAEVAKLRAGDFDEKLIKASVNNYKMNMMKEFDNYSERASFYVNNFIANADLKESLHQTDRMAKLTKQDIVAWANKYLGANSYAIIFKRQGVDPNEQKIAAPKITPIVMNRNLESQFLTEVKNKEVQPIEPVFVDYEKDMSQFEERKGVNVLYKKNTSNDIFSMTYVFNTGKNDNPNLGVAFSYLNYLGTNDMPYKDFAVKMYELACQVNMGAGKNISTITVSGLSENMAAAMEIVEKLLSDAVGDNEILTNLKNDYLQSRANSKLNQGSCFGALQNYLFYGPETIRKTTLSNDELMKLQSDKLLADIKSLKGYQHEILYYGPMTEKELKGVLNAHHATDANLKPLERRYDKTVTTAEPKVYLTQYDAKQLYYLQFCNFDKVFNVTNDPNFALYNQYFGGGMNSIVFQEMREARGLAYSAQAGIMGGGHADDTYGYIAFIATQNDKMKAAIQAFDEIINNMPESESAFQIAKQSILARLRTARTVKQDILFSYLDIRNLKLKQDRNKALFEKIQHMTLEDVKAIQKEWVANRKYIYGILGDIKDLDMDYLKTMGPVEVISKEDIFGY